MEKLQAPTNEAGDFNNQGGKTGGQTKGQSNRTTPSASRLGAQSVVPASTAETPSKSAKRKPAESAGGDARKNKNTQKTRYHAGQRSEDEKRQEFEKYRVDARTRATAGKFDQAIEMYTKAIGLQNEDADCEALQLKADHVECLVARARCYHELSEYDKALRDTEAALRVNPRHAKANHIKGEAHYQKGEFEFALVCFHRAKRLRPGVVEYDRDIKKAEGAIEASIGASSGASLRIQGDLSFFDNQNEADEDSVQLLIRQTSAQRKEALAVRDRRRADKTGGRDPKTIKQLLGVLYGDWKYLEDLLRDEDRLLDELDEEEKEQEMKRKRLIKEKREAMKGGNSLQQVEEDDDKLIPKDSFIEVNRKKRRQFSENIREYTDRELTYLIERTEFWMQQKPPVKKNKAKNSKEEALTKEILEKLENIEEDLSLDKREESLRKTRKLLTEIESSSALRHNQKQELLGSAYSVLGCCYFDMMEYSKALECHLKDLRIAEDLELEEAVSRALDNVGRTYARRGEYRNAIKIFERKIPMAESSLEKTWLYHELGRCYLEIHNHQKAKECAKRSVESANEVDDSAWQMNAYVLLAQIEVELKNYSAALEAFDKALTTAKIDDDDEAKAVITKAIADVKKRIEAETKTSDDTLPKSTDKLQSSNSTMTSVSTRTRSKEMTSDEQMADSFTTKTSEDSENERNDGSYIKGISTKDESDTSTSVKTANSKDKDCEDLA